MARLTKRDVERLLAGYDADPAGALATALGVVLDRPGARFADLVDQAPFDDARRAALLAGDVAALDGLVAELNERRALRPDPP